MKISQEVREFARLQNQDSVGFIAATPTVRPELVEGQVVQGEGGSPSVAYGSTGSARTEMTEAEAEAGMAEMSKVYDENGRELYMGAGDREHD